MILTDISPYIAINEIVNTDSENYIHFLTHVDCQLSIPKNWKSRIYTSTYISNIYWQLKKKIDRKYFSILLPDEEVTICLPNGTRINVTMFQINQITGNVAYFFENSTKKVFILGPFTNCRELLLNSRLREKIIDGIDVLYLDNTRANCEVETLLPEVCLKLKSILKKHPGYTIMLHIPPFGYEELIEALLIQFPHKIMAGEHIIKIFSKFNNLKNLFAKNFTESVQIVIGEEKLIKTKIQRCFSIYKLINVRIIDGNKPSKDSMLFNGFYEINWSSHPTVMQMITIITFLRPSNIKKIYEEMPDFPKFLQYLFIPPYELEIEENDNRENEEEDDFLLNTSIKNYKASKKFDEQQYDEITDDNIEHITISTDSQVENERTRIKLPKRKKKKRNQLIGVVPPNNASTSFRLENNRTSISRNVLQNHVPELSVIVSENTNENTTQKPILSERSKKLNEAMSSIQGSHELSNDSGDSLIRLTNSSYETVPNSRYDKEDGQELNQNKSTVNNDELFMDSGTLYLSQIKKTSSSSVITEGVLNHLSQINSHTNKQYSNQNNEIEENLKLFDDSGCSSIELIHESETSDEIDEFVTFPKRRKFQQSQELWSKVSQIQNSPKRKKEVKSTKKKKPNKKQSSKAVVIHEKVNLKYRLKHRAVIYDSD